MKDLLDITSLCKALAEQKPGGLIKGETLLRAISFGVPTRLERIWHINKRYEIRNNFK